jgi:chemotaxis protein methyltransferase CheR
MGTGLPPLERHEFDALRTAVHRITGISLSDAKRTLVQTRLVKRLRELGLPDFESYVTHLEHDAPGERDALIAAMTTHTTHFWREAHHFDELKRLVFAPARARRTEKLRLWSAASSSGEEVYCMAMCAAEQLDLARCDVKILATDIDNVILQRAEKGVYDRDGLEERPQYLRYFTEGAGDQADFVRVKPELRALVRFRQLNLVKQPWPVRPIFDAIFIRNVLIYFDAPTQAAVTGHLARHLAPGGILVFGHAESMLGAQSGLTPLGQGIFRRAA